MYILCYFANLLAWLEIIENILIRRSICRYIVSITQDNLKRILFMVSIREISDDKSSISSTRWAFASIVKFDIAIIALTIIAYIVGHFIGKPFDSNLISGVSLLLGVLTGILTTSKIFQGFEPGNKSDNKEELLTE